MGFLEKLFGKKGVEEKTQETVSSQQEPITESIKAPMLTKSERANRAEQDAINYFSRMLMISTGDMGKLHSLIDAKATVAIRGGVDNGWVQAKIVGSDEKNVEVEMVEDGGIKSMMTVPQTVFMNWQREIMQNLGVDRDYVNKEADVVAKYGNDLFNKWDKEATELMIRDANGAWRRAQVGKFSVDKSLVEMSYVVKEGFSEKATEKLIRVDVPTRILVGWQAETAWNKGKDK